MSKSYTFFVQRESYTFFVETVLIAICFSTECSLNKDKNAEKRKTYAAMEVEEINQRNAKRMKVYESSVGMFLIPKFIFIIPFTQSMAILLLSVLKNIQF